MDVSSGYQAFHEDDALGAGALLAKAEQVKAAGIDALRESGRSWLVIVMQEDGSAAAAHGCVVGNAADAAGEVFALARAAEMGAGAMLEQVAAMLGSIIEEEAQGE